MIKVKMLKNVSSDVLFLKPNPFFRALIGEEYEAETNPHGAISIRVKGQLLGITPDEFEFIEAPAWVLEKHGKLSPKYEELQEENKNLTESLKLFSNEYTRRLELQEVVEKIKNQLIKYSKLIDMENGEAVEKIIHIQPETEELIEEVEEVLKCQSK